MPNNPFDFSRGGQSWSGWTFGPYGKAREWRLFAPTGEMFTASEILGMRANALDVDYLQCKARRLESEKTELERKLAQRFTPEEFETLREAMAIIASRVDREPLPIKTGLGNIRYLRFGNGP